MSPQRSAQNSRAATGASARRGGVFSGVAASPGIAFGPAFLVSRHAAGVEAYALKTSEVEAEVRKFLNAVETAKEMVRHSRDEIASHVDSKLAQIFEGHLGLLEDPGLIEETAARIRSERRNASGILTAIIEEHAARVAHSDSAAIASIVADLRDVGARIISQLAPVHGSEAICPATPSIVVAHDLAPSQTAHMARERVEGFCTDVGGPVSHAVLLAKALEIPAVVGLGDFFSQVAAGDSIVIDGFSGTVILNPSARELASYRKQWREWRARGTALGRLRKLPAETRDGYLVDLAANIELPAEVPHVLYHGACGIGLFRTEFLYMREGDLPGEDEQFEVYRSVLTRLRPRPVVFRTLDVGGDKFLSQVPTLRELNPFLGVRAIRLCLQYPEIFKPQLRAILRASHYGNARVMFPMITGIGELRQAKAILEETRRELAEEGVPFDGSMEVGIMIEVPAAALTADALAEEVDFFSIGTNDLIQYSLAVDRGNEHVAHLYDPYHPSILRMIRETIAAAHRQGIWAAVCGEMASDPDLACLLIALGVDELSMASGSIPAVKERIRSVTIASLKTLGAEVSGLSSSEEIRALVADRMASLTHLRGARRT